MKGSSKDVNIKMIFLLFLIHFTGDFYNSFVSPLLPAFASAFSLTLTQVGFLAAISRVLSFVVQPPVGYLADHYRTRLFILGGPLLSTIFMSLTGAAPNFLGLAFFVALGSMGAAMFHPTAAGMVYSFAGHRFAFSMAFYNFGGTLAFGVGPVFITYLVARFGLHSSIFAMILGLIILVLICRRVPLPGQEGLRKFGFIGSLKEVFGGVWGAIALIWGLGAAINYAVQRAFGIDSWIAAMTLLAVLMIGIALPPSIAALGVFEGLTMLTLGIFDIPLETALAVGLMLHLVVVVPLSISAAALWLLSGRKRCVPRP